ncbi:MAG: 4-hydroxy-tetrahydrodipicolinate reductase [Micrococcales bacterium]|nr:MAG: 4-hydroxy-tetrahydrodipicolinate reductase [Micrococcales bacterium]PIE27845.1 MAG: 4-hydroxy-tetrahydrodipicolinate reductase [Micrococcales bacterium]
MSERLRVAVIGARGRMGATTCAAVSGTDDLDLVAEIDQGDDLNDLVAANAEVAVVFSVPGVAREHVRFLIANGVHAVVGTTGWDDDALTAVRHQLGDSPSVGVLIAPNFALGAVLAMVFAQQAAALFESVEVIELHHPDKVDAPSGTAHRTAQLIAAARDHAGVAVPPDATASALPGARGAAVDGIAVHSVRLRGLIAHEEILFGNPGEQFTIRHDSFDRQSFMPGVLLGVRTVPGRAGLTVGLEHFMPL